MDSPNARYGIMASGKSYEDIRQGAARTRVTPGGRGQNRIALYKIGMPGPLEAAGRARFAVGLEEIFIIEERREIGRNQVKQELLTGATMCGRASSARWTITTSASCRSPKMSVASLRVR